MRLIHACLALVFCLVFSPASAEVLTQTEARAFFARYVELGEAYDVGLAELYANDAVIRSERHYPHGETRAIQVSGQQWKALIVNVMPQAKARQDRSTYANVKVSVSGNRAKISADRYSELKCYTDPAYYMVIERRSDGEYRIVEEYTQTRPQSNC